MTPNAIGIEALLKGEVSMKGKAIAIGLALLMTILLFPIPLRYKDGGTVEYRAVLYSVYDVHRLAMEPEDGFEEGIIVEILGIEIYNALGR